MGNLSVHQPLFLWAAALVLPLALLHMYWKRRKRRIVPSVSLLRESWGPVRKQARFRKLQDRLALLARALGLGALVCALAGLAPRQAATRATPELLWIDADRTMSAREGDGASRLAHARRALEAHVLALPHNGDELLAPAAIWRGGRTTSALVPWTRDRAALLDGSASLAEQPDPAATPMTVHVEALAKALAVQPNARCTLITHRALPKEASAAAMRRFGVGQARDDQGVVHLEVMRSEDGARYEVLAKVHNVSTQSATRTLRLRMDNLPVHEEALTVAPGARASVTHQVPAPDTEAWLVAELLGEDDWSANDAQRAALAPSTRPSVLVVHDGGVRPYTRALLDALAGFVDVERSGLIDVKHWGRAPDADVVLVDGAALPEGGLRRGAWIFLAPLRGALPFEAGAPVPDPLVWRSHASHPLLRHVDLSTAYAVRAQPIAGEGVVPLAFAGEAAVLAEGAREGLRYVALGLDPEASALPLSPALPLLVRKAIARLVAERARPFAPRVSAGSRVAIRGGALMKSVNITWQGFARDPLLRHVARGEQAGVRLGPTRGWTVPAEAEGRLELREGSGPGATLHRMGIAPQDAARSIAPAGPADPLPKAAAPIRDTRAQWRAGLLLLALLFFLVDLAMIRRAARRSIA